MWMELDEQIHKNVIFLGNTSDVTISDIGTDDLIDPSLNIQQTEKKIERSRRSSRMENEAITRQKLLRRVQSHEEKENEQQEQDQ